MMHWAYGLQTGGTPGLWKLVQDFQCSSMWTCGGGTIAASPGWTLGLVTWQVSGQPQQCALRLARSGRVGLTWLKSPAPPTKPPGVVVGLSAHIVINFEISSSHGTVIILD